MSSQKDSGITPQALKGTKTEQNLHTALSGESQAALRYGWFSQKAKAQGLISISKLFEETANNEVEHAEIWFRYLGGYHNTEQNLEVAANGEHFEWEEMYAQFAREAREEGFETLAELFDRIASVEKRHEENYRKATANLESGAIFSSDDPQQKWICLNCGYVYTGAEPPTFCPACTHPKGYFEKLQQC